MTVFSFLIIIYVDSVENQEGGAMYISCGDDAVAVEAEMGYVPNNPLFGLPLDSPQVNSHFTFCNTIQKCWIQYKYDLYRNCKLFYQISKFALFIFELSALNWGEEIEG